MLYPVELRALYPFAEFHGRSPSIKVTRTTNHPSAAERDITAFSLKSDALGGALNVFKLLAVRYWKPRYIQEALTVCLVGARPLSQSNG